MYQKMTALLAATALLGMTLPYVHADPTTPAAPSGTALTIYNENFAVVSQMLPLTLTAGVNHITFSDITGHLEPDSVILRDPTGEQNLQILEQNYRADPVTQDRLLALYQGQTIDFQATVNGQQVLIPGKIIRSGYVPMDSEFNYNDDNGYPYYQQQQPNDQTNQPIIEVDGKLQFSLPGIPLFPALTDDSILQPTLDISLQADKAGPLNAQLAYVTDDMSWKAAYNVVAPPTGDTLDITGWVTMDNQSGLTFTNARIKLMAGDVNKVQPHNQYAVMAFNGGTVLNSNSYVPPVSEKTFDEYHLYTLANPTTLRDKETKQVQFVHAQNVKATTIYVYDGAYIDPDQYNGWTYDNIRNTPSYGTQSNPKVWVMREIVNSKANHLGIPLPAGRMRFYREDTDGQLEFTGENNIDHTPKDETLRVYTGDAFDLVGSRTQTNYVIKNGYNSAPSTSDESFAITVTNHKTVAVPVRVVEHLYRGDNWTITASSDKYVKTDAHTIEFDTSLAPNEEKTVTYTVQYTW